MTKASERALNYAREREWRNLDRIHQSDAEVVAELNRILERTLDNCKAQAEAWYTRYAAANGITPAEARKRATEADIAALERKAKDYVARRKDTAYAFSEQANKEMAEYNFSMKMSREELLMRYIDLELSAGTDEENTLLGDHLTKLSEDELKRQAGLLGMRLPDHKELTDLARTIATSSFHGETFSYRLWQNQSSLRALLGDGIARSILLGKNPTTWMRSLEGHLRDAGNNAKYRLKRLAITEAGRVQIEAQKQSYDRAGYSQYIVVCEPTACPVCREHDGKVYNVKDLMQGKNAPMFHPFCKCSTAAHMDRREVERGFAELEKEIGLSPEKRFSNILKSVEQNIEALKRSDIPDGFYLKLTDEERHAKIIDNYVEHAYEKHRKEYSEINSKKEFSDYMLRCAQADGDHIERYVRADGSVVKYNSMTNDFLVISEDQVITTMFRPKLRKEYYENDKQSNEEHPNR